jgi:uncharacterized protein
VLIEEMTIQASLDLLARTRLGRLACAKGPQPYVVPFYFAYQDYSLYSFTTVGQKIEWMRANPLVCVEADEVVSSQEWLSVVVLGCYEELLDTPERQPDREFAWQLLQQYAMWWEPCLAKTIIHGTERSQVPVFYRIHTVRITGHRATVEAPDTRLYEQSPDEAVAANIESKDLSGFPEPKRCPIPRH